VPLCSLPKGLHTVLSSERSWTKDETGRDPREHAHKARRDDATAVFEEFDRKLNTGLDKSTPHLSGWNHGQRDSAERTYS